MEKRKILLSICAVMALVGCGSSSDYKVDSNILPENEIEEVQEGFVDNGGLTGRVISSSYEEGSKVCFDLNKDGLCNTSEPSQLTFEGGKFSFEKEVSDLYTDEILLAEINKTITSAAVGDTEISYVLSANQSNTSEDSINITPFTTILVNEQTYNPYTINSKAESLTYLSTNITGMNESLLTGEDYVSADTTNVISKATNLTSAYSQSYSLNKTAPYLSIATVVDEVVKSDDFNVTISALNVQENFVNTLTLEDSNQSITWDKLYDDETTLGSAYSSDNSKVVVNSMWNNKLTVLDTSDKTKAATVRDNQQFLYVSGGKDVIDTTTGATEQELDKVKLSSDGNTVYSLIIEAESTIGTGIYKTDISTSVPDTSYASVVEGSTYYSEDDITDIVLSTDDSILVAARDGKEILIFDTSDLTSPTKTIVTTKKVKIIEISEDKKYIFAGLSKRKGYSIAIYDASSGELLSELLTEDTPNHICIKDENELFFSIKDESMIRNIDITDKTSIVEKDSISTSAAILNLNILKDDDKKYLISSLNTQVSVYDLEDSSNIATLNLSLSVKNAFKVDSNKIAVVHNRSMDYLTLKESEIGTISDEAKTTWNTTHRTVDP